MTILSQLCRAIQASKLTQVEIARRADVNTMTITRLLHAQRAPSLETVEKIAAALGKKLLLK